MSAHINTSILKNFISKTINGDKIAVDRAGKFGIDRDKVEEVNENDNNYIEIDEILDDKDLYAQFASMYFEEQETKNEKDEEKEKEEKYKVKDKKGAGAA